MVIFYVRFLLFYLLQQGLINTASVSLPRFFLLVCEVRFLSLILLFLVLYIQVMSINIHYVSPLFLFIRHSASLLHKKLLAIILLYLLAPLRWVGFFTRFLPPSSFPQSFLFLWNNFSRSTHIRHCKSKREIVVIVLRSKF